VRWFSEVWRLLKDTILSFINDEALSRGAAVAFYTVTSIAGLAHRYCHRGTGLRSGCCPESDYLAAQ
jgi:hypothetical protein